ncbi:hypothetical protein [Kitasatospora sp. NPDC057015]|uniref:hypothetical protein n=1 Tax=Kitasatospora sp. NPDC057015 TaxID=3346001 RepID=UPI003630ACF6
MSATSRTMLIPNMDISSLATSPASVKVTLPFAEKSCQYAPTIGWCLLVAVELASGPARRGLLPPSGPVGFRLACRAKRVTDEFLGCGAIDLPIGVGGESVDEQ